MRWIGIASILGIAAASAALARVPLWLDLGPPIWLVVQSGVAGCVQLASAVYLWRAPSKRSLSYFLLVFGVASLWDGSKFFLGYRPIYLLPVAAFVAGLAARAVGTPQRDAVPRSGTADGSGA